MMAEADGRVTIDERRIIESVFVQKFGVTNESEADHIERLAGELESPADLSYIRNMDAEKKEYVTAFWEALMAVDGEINGKELVLMNLVSNLCELPEMTVGRATEILSIDLNQYK